MNCRCEGRRVCGREDGRFGLAADFLASSGGRRRSLLDLVALQGCAVCHRTQLGTHWTRCCAGGDCSALHGGHPVALTALDSSTAAYRTTAHRDPSTSWVPHYRRTDHIEWSAALRCWRRFHPHRGAAVLCRRAPARLPRLTSVPRRTLTSPCSKPPPVPSISGAGTVSFRAPSRWGGEGGPSLPRPGGRRGTLGAHNAHIGHLHAATAWPTYV